jgi:hypothetical protein
MLIQLILNNHGSNNESGRIAAFIEKGRKKVKKDDNFEVIK